MTKLIGGLYIMKNFVSLFNHYICRRGAVVKRVEHISTIVLVIMSGAGSSPAGSVGRDLNLQKLNY